jgi:hypothetical protein
MRKEKRISGPAEFGGAADCPEIGEHVSGLRKGDIDSLRVREIADIVEQHRVCSCEGGRRVGGRPGFYV